MNMINRFIIEDVRLFKGGHDFEIRPLILVTGGNNTGKTTFLGCMQILLDTPSGYRNFFLKETDSLLGFD